MTFSRTPPHSDNEEDPIIINDSLTNEENNNFGNTPIALSPVMAHVSDCHDNHITETRLTEQASLPAVTQDNVTTPTLRLVEMAGIPETSSQTPHRVTFDSNILPALESAPLQLTNQPLLPPIEDNKTTPIEPSINSPTVRPEETLEIIY